MEKNMHYYVNKLRQNVGLETWKWRQVVTSQAAQTKYKWSPYDPYPKILPWKFSAYATGQPGENSSGTASVSHNAASGLPYKSSGAHRAIWVWDPCSMITRTRLLLFEKITNDEKLLSCYSSKFISHRTFSNAFEDLSLRTTKSDSKEFIVSMINHKRAFLIVVCNYELIFLKLTLVILSSCHRIRSAIVVPIPGTSSTIFSLIGVETKSICFWDGLSMLLVIYFNDVKWF